jgi:hypothetical protein
MKVGTNEENVVRRKLLTSISRKGQAVAHYEANARTTACANPAIDGIICLV